MATRMKWHLAVSLCVTIIGVADASAQTTMPTKVSQPRLALDLFGLSYHYQGSTYKDQAGNSRAYDQFNPGVGIAYSLNDSTSSLWSIHVGAYRNSLRTASKFGALAWQWRCGCHLRAGVALAVLNDRDGGTRLGPLPLVSFGSRRVAVNAILIPSVSEGLSGAIGMFATVWLRSSRDYP